MKNNQNFENTNFKSFSDSIFYFLFSIFSFIVFLLSIFYFLDFSKVALAGIDIDSTYRYAWNDVIGWIDFYFDDVHVIGERMKGYATSSVGYIAFDCQSSPNGNICATSDFKVSNSGGNLTGWAWNDIIGWISFDSGTASSSYPYQVTINPLTGIFSGWAWNDVIGWMSFNCYDTNICLTSDYKVKTAWRAVPLTATLISSVYDTGVTTGVALNNIVWQGYLPSGTSVQFQIASSNCANGASNPPQCNGPTWPYRGPDGTESTFYGPSSPGIAIPINSAFHSNHRYYRYKAFLFSNAGQTQTPRVDDVIINWSP